MGERGSDSRGIVLVVLVLAATAMAAAVLPPHPFSKPAFPPSPFLRDRSAADASATLDGAPPPGAYFDYVLILLMENHAICTILKGVDNCTSGSGPYETGLALNSSLATGYVDCSHPSLPNYLCLSGASTFGCTGYDGLPHSNTCTDVAWNSPNIVDVLVGANLSWKAYAENMPSNCYGANSGSYYARHFPFVYYNDIVSNASRVARCVPAGTNDSALLGDLNSTSTASNYMWLTPNGCNDMHDCNVATGDAYLKQLVPKILNSTVFQTQRAALFITFDEDSGTAGAPYLYTVWAGPAAKAKHASSTSYDHFSLLSTIEANWNLTHLNANDTNAANMSEFLTSPPPPPPPPPPSLAANFSFSPSNPIAGQTVTFAGTASGGTPPYSFAWDFGDATTGSGASTTHVYGGPGSYVVNLTATDSGSATASVYKTVNVTSSPPPLTGNITFSPSAPLTGQTVTFAASASGGAPPYSYGWEFGDGTTGSGATSTHEYATAGAYVVNLTVTDSASNTARSSTTVTVSEPPPALAANFTFNPSNPTAGQSVTFTANASGGAPPYSYAWQFGDGATDTGAMPSHTYAAAGTYIVNLTVTDAASNTSTASHSVLVSPLPPPPLVASFTFQPASPTAGQPVNFSASVSGGTPPYGESWSFGDGATASGAAVSHTYATAGTYTVNLTATDAGLQTVIVSQSVAVASPPPPPPPPSLTANFTLSPTNPIANETVAFNATASGGTPPYSFGWAFGDGSTGSGADVGHAYASPGTYTVNLTVTDAASEVAYAESTVVVSPAPPPPGSPTARFATSPDWPQANATVTFNASASSDPNPGATLQFRWDWTNNGIWDTAWSSSPIGTHAYGSSGMYTARLEVLDSLGLTANATGKVTVDSVPPVTTASLAGSLGDSGWYVSAVTVTLSATDGLSGVASTSYSVDNGTWQAYSTPFTVGGDGDHSVLFRSTDNAGNVEPVETADFRIDATPPATTATLTGTQGSGGWYVSNVTVALNASDATSGVAEILYQVDGGPWQTYSGVLVMGDGQHILGFYSTDLAGNTESPHIVSIDVDTVPPSAAATLTGTPGANGWYVSNVTVSLNATDALSGVAQIRYAIDGGAWQTYSGSFLIGEGTHVIRFYAADVAGNAESVQTLTVAVDTTPPATTGALSGDTGQAGWYVSNVSVSLNATDGAGSVAAISYRVDGGPWSNYTGPFILTDGQHEVDFYATDLAGLSSPVESLTVSVDTTPPTTSLLENGTAGNGTWYLSNVTITLSASDATSGVARVSYSVDGGPWQTYAGPLTLSEGVHVLEYRATDVAGLNSAAERTTIAVDTTPPETAATFSGTSGNDGWYVSNVTVVLRGTDATSGVQEVVYRIDGGAWQTYRGPFLIGEGQHTLEFLATDNAGLAGPSQSADISVDVSPPVTTATLSGQQGNGSWYLSNVSVSLVTMDPLSGVYASEWSVDGGAWTPYVGAFLIQGGGRHLLQFASVDLAGNREPMQTVEVDIEDSGPSFASISASGNATAPNVTISWTAVEDDSPIVGYGVSVDNGPYMWVGMHTEVSLSLSSGMHTVRVRALDAAGLQAVSSVTIRVYPPTSPGSGTSSPAPATPVASPPWFASGAILIIIVIASLAATVAGLVGTLRHRRSYRRH